MATAYAKNAMTHCIHLILLMTLGTLHQLEASSHQADPASTSTIASTSTSAASAPASPPLSASGAVPANVPGYPSPTTTMPMLHGPFAMPAHEDGPASAPLPVAAPVVQSAAPVATSSHLETGVRQTTPARLRGSKKIEKESVNAEANTFEIMVNDNSKDTSDVGNGNGSPSEALEAVAAEVQLKSSRHRRYFPIGGGFR